MQMNFLHFLFYYYDRESCMSLETLFKLKKKKALKEILVSLISSHTFPYFLCFIYFLKVWELNFF